MNCKTTPIKIQSTDGRLLTVRFLDGGYMNKQFSSSFPIHSELIRCNIPKRMWIKCGIQWRAGVNENCWIEIAETNKDDLGRVTYMARFDEFNLGGLEAGSIAFDIEPKHILDYDFERFKKLFTH